jgi:phosphopantothenoylcysteine decarboxylase/phosphopantothenate--cysteine ligase
MARVLLGVTGGIAAYKALELCRLALKAGHRVRVIQTEAATRFVGPASFAGITGAPVLRTEWEPDALRGVFPGDPVPDSAPLSHLALVDQADVLVIAPASANTVAKLAHGQADNLLTAAALACRRPVLVAPAMNGAMYEHPATQANLELLRARGVEVLPPGTGSLGSPGEWGVGRLPEPPEILAALERRLEPGRGERALDGVSVLVTAGGTREPIDAVRFVGNRSSGRMGFALAEAAARRGASVTVVAASVGLPRAREIEYVDVQTAAELAAATRERFAAADVLLMAAAVADYRPADPHAGKLKKETTGEHLDLRLERTEDVVATLAGERRPGQVLVGFAAEAGEDVVANAREKLVRKGLDAVVVNDVSRAGIGFEALENEVVIVLAEEERAVPRAPKAEVAGAILDVVSTLRRALEVR